MEDEYEKIKQTLQDQLCETCPYMLGQVSLPSGMSCDGQYCNEAVDNYINQNEDENG